MYPAIVSSERQGKPAALALLASMAIVAMTLWAWPSPSPQIRHTSHSDVALPASVPVLLPVAALPPAAREDRQAAVRVEARAPETREKVQAPPGLPSLTLEPPDLAAIGADAPRPGPVLIASHAVVLPMRPLVAAAPRSAAMPIDSNGNALAHAGMAIGSAFRRAGVNAGAAFSRIF